MTMQFIMTAQSQPKNSYKWFAGFQEGSIFNAENQEQAQDWLNSQCDIAGTDRDPNFIDFGPYAVDSHL